MTPAALPVPSPRSRLQNRLSVMALRPLRSLRELNSLERPRRARNRSGARGGGVFQGRRFWLFSRFRIPPELEDCIVLKPGAERSRDKSLVEIGRKIRETTIFRPIAFGCDGSPWTFGNRHFRHAKCHNENAPSVTTKTRQVSQRKRAKCHNENAPSVTTKTRQVSQRKHGDAEVWSRLRRLFPARAAGSKNA